MKNIETGESLMQVEVKEYDRAEEEKVEELIQMNFEEASLLVILDSNHLKFAYSAYWKHKMVGIIIAWTDIFHPYCSNFRILINPFYNRKSIKEKLLSKMEVKVDGKTPLVTSLWEDI